MKTLNAPTFVLILIASFLTINAFAADIIRDSKQKKGLYYQVNIIEQLIDDDMFNRFETVDQYVTSNSDYNFRLGVFNSYKQAKTEAANLKHEGYKQVEVVAYFNRASISLEDAMVFSNNQMKYEDNLSLDGQTISVQELNKIILDNAGEVELSYKIHLGLTAVQKEIPSFDPTIENKVIETEQGFYTYRVGSFDSKQSAIQYRKQLVNAGIKEAIVVPYFNGKRVSLTLAEKFENISEANMANLAK